MCVWLYICVCVLLYDVCVCITIYKQMGFNLFQPCVSKYSWLTSLVACAMSGSLRICLAGWLPTAFIKALPILWGKPWDVMRCTSWPQSRWDVLPLTLHVAPHVNICVDKDFGTWWGVHRDHKAGEMRCLWCYMWCYTWTSVLKKTLRRDEVFIVTTKQVRCAAFDATCDATHEHLSWERLWDVMRWAPWQ